MAVMRKTTSDSTGSDSGAKKPKRSAAPADDPMRSSLANELSTDDDDDEDLRQGSDDDDDDDVLEDSTLPIKKILIIGGVVVAVILAAILIFVVTRPKPEPPPPPPEPTEVIDQGALDANAMYQSGIGKEYVDEAKVYEQGNIENETFRKDFSQNGQPEDFVLPIKINTTKDAVSYKKHRAITGVGVEIYWVEGEYRGRACSFTIPYSIYQVIDDEGVLDVEVEVVTDKTGSQTVTSFTALPPAKRK